MSMKRSNSSTQSYWKDTINNFSQVVWIEDTSKDWGEAGEKNHEQGEI